MPKLTHENAVIVVPREGSMLDSFIAPGSGIVAVHSAFGGLILYYEGNLNEADNLHSPEDRVICSFGRAAVSYPTTAMMGVFATDVLDVIRVGSITWPNQISWDSPASYQRFMEHANRYQGKPRQYSGPALKFSNLYEIKANAFFPECESPRKLAEWRWIRSAMHV